jgi:gamma-glutamyltranspeptidase/glutathione hydrolase
MRTIRGARFRASSRFPGTIALLALACAAPSQQPARVQPQTPPAAVPEASAGPLFPSANRPDVRGNTGAVSSDHPLASAAGYEVLRRGGKAMDAIIAMAGVLAVVRPHMNGVGGDAFALVYDGATGQVTALNGSGRAGALATPEFFGGRSRLPSNGALTVTVPGTVAAWVDALERHGSRPLAELLAPAIGYARDGFPVSSRLHSDIEDQSGSLNAPGRAQYLPGGSPPPVGERLRNPALARTLEAIAARGKDGFYQGAVAERLASFVRSEGGYLTPADFAAHTSTWVEPLSADYLGHRFLALPPNSQGVAQLQQLEMAKAFDLKGMGYNSASYLHTLIEISKLSAADAERWVADPEHASVPVGAMLDAAYLRRRAGQISATRAAADVASGIGAPVGAEGIDREGEDGGDTVYLTAVDQWGNAVSWIQSLYSGFGSGLFEPETGVMLQNRGALFVLDEGHPNRVAPGKRPYHTLSPLMALRDGRLAFTLGTPGGDGQTQTLLKIINDLLLFGLTPQEAVESPRFRAGNGLTVSIEERIPLAERGRLEALGHELRVIQGWTATFGGAQMILVDPRTRTLVAAADPRREAYALAY